MSRHIIERCPSCGVEHDVRVDGCEACGTALRHWCRAHSREIGWLESAECRRCAEDDARRRPRVAVPVSTAPPMAAPPPAPPVASPREAVPPPAMPPRPPSSVTPYWCGTHSPEIGFLASPVCPRCAEEAARILRATVPAAAPPPPAAAPPSPGRRTMPAPPPPAPVHAAPAPAPADARGSVDAGEPERPGVLLRLFDALLSMLWVVIVCILVGVAAGGMQAAISQGDIPLMAVHWGVYGGMLGVLLGFFYAVGHFNLSGRRVKR